MAKLPWTIALLLTTITALAMSSACTVDNAFLDQEGLFFCEADTDCDPGYECREQSCKRPVDPNNAKCIDEDNDGYGVGENRLPCDKPEEDTDDTDKDIYPGAPDICDGKDNDSDANTPDGQLSCGNAGDCPQSAAPQGAIFFCEGSLCTLKPAKSTSDVCKMAIPCNAGAYAAVPAECL